MIAPDEKMQFASLSLTRNYYWIRDTYIEDTWSIFDRKISLHHPRNMKEFLKIIWLIQSTSPNNGAIIENRQL